MEIRHEGERSVNGNMRVALSYIQVFFVCVGFVSGEEKEVIVRDTLETANETKSADGQQDI